MAILLESVLDGACTIVESTFYMNTGEAGTRGEVVVASAGKLTKCAATGTPQYLLTNSPAAGAQAQHIAIRRDQIFVADIAGTASLVAAVVGQKTVCLDSTATKIDAAALTGGKCEIVSVDTVKGKARIKFDL